MQPIRFLTNVNDARLKYLPAKYRWVVNPIQYRAHRVPAGSDKNDERALLCVCGQEVVHVAVLDLRRDKQIALVQLCDCGLSAKHTDVRLEAERA